MINVPATAVTDPGHEPDFELIGEMQREFVVVLSPPNEFGGGTDEGTKKVAAAEGRHLG